MSLFPATTSRSAQTTDYYALEHRFGGVMSQNGQGYIVPGAGHFYRRLDVILKPSCATLYHSAPNAPDAAIRGYLGLGGNSRAVNNRVDLYEWMLGLGHRSKSEPGAIFTTNSKT